MRLRAFIASGLLAACGSPDTEQPPVIARVNGEPITEQQVASLPSASEAAPQEGLEIAIDLALSAQEARRLGLAAAKTPERSEEQRLQDALFASVRDSLVLSEEELRAHYAKTSVRWVARQVLLRRRPFASESEARAEDRRLGPTGRLPADSDAIGPLPLESLPMTVLPEALSLTSPGQRAAIQRDGQWWLLELSEIRSAEALSFESVRPKVEQSLRLIRAQSAFRAELARLRAEAAIERSD